MIFLVGHIFVIISSKHLHSQTVWARDFSFWGNVPLPPCVNVTCQVLCHMSGITWHMSHVTFFYIVVKLLDGGSVTNGAFPVWLNYLWITTNQLEIYSFLLWDKLFKNILKFLNLKGHQNHMTSSVVLVISIKNMLLDHELAKGYFLTTLIGFDLETIYKNIS